MPLYIRPSGGSTFAIGICARCKLKRPYDALGDDLNYPGLRVCQDKGPRGCADEFDPYRLPQRQVEKFTLSEPRPDNSVATTQAEADDYKTTFGDTT